MVPLG